MLSRLGRVKATSTTARAARKIPRAIIRRLFEVPCVASGKVFMSFPVDVVVMAAGKGTRMKSSKPKVLHRLGGRALAQHVIDTAARVSARSVVVITGHGAEQVVSWI